MRFWVPYGLSWLLMIGGGAVFVLSPLIASELPTQGGVGGVIAFVVGLVINRILMHITGRSGAPDKRE